MKKISLLLCPLIIIGCAPVAEPHLINGQYFMGGDENCIKFLPVSPTRIMCRNSKDENTGYRDAMSPAELQMYQYQKIQAQIQANQFLQQQNAASAAFQQNTNNFLQSIQNNYQPQMPIFPQRRGNINCLNTGMTINCSY